MIGSKHICLIVGATAWAGACYGTKPNVIYIFPDQFRNSSMNFWGSEPFRDSVRWRPDPVVTPNLDAFARQSVVLTEATSAFPLSSPHRGMLLSGMYPERNGITLNCMEQRPESSLRQDAECMSDVFSRQGYNCAYIGKLHTDFPTKNNPQRPGTYVSDTTPEWDAYTPAERRHGFDYWYSYGTFDVHKKPHYWDKDGKRHEIRDFSPKHEADKAIEYIENRKGERDDSKPFFMMVSMNPPHSPYQSLDDCMEQDLNIYKDRSPSELLLRGNADTTMAKSRSVPYYFANVTAVDREFGRLMQALSRAGLEQNTIVVFSSDHGETMCSHGINDAKNSIYREAFNVPFMVRYPKVLKPALDNLLLTTVDVMPTLLSLSGLGAHIPQSVQGRDLSPVLQGAPMQRPTAVLYMRNVDGEKGPNGLVSGFFAQARGVKTHSHTMEIAIKGDGTLKGVRIYDDINDPYQLHNLYSSTSQPLFRALCQELAQVLKSSDDVWYRKGILSKLITYNN